MRSTLSRLADKIADIFAFFLILSQIFAIAYLRVAAIHLHRGRRLLGVRDPSSQKVTLHPAVVCALKLFFSDLTLPAVWRSRKILGVIRYSGDCVLSIGNYDCPSEKSREMGENSRRR